MGNSRFRIGVFTIMGVITLYYTVAILMTVFECIPVARSWDKTKHGTCINARGFYFANAAFNVASDLMVMLLPIPVIIRLQLKKAAKIGLVFLFIIGFLSVIVG